ncbi:hypothetical protein PABG_02655 [Paracoccidioides brasiliensis Pb03]|nr:hypothetical protein PABG_02655 [Paracoccidioides brasiliensis Pb03]
MSFSGGNMVNPQELVDDSLILEQKYVEYFRPTAAQPPEVAINFPGTHRLVNTSSDQNGMRGTQPSLEHTIQEFTVQEAGWAKSVLGLQMRPNPYETYQGTTA